MSSPRAVSALSLENRMRLAPTAFLKGMARIGIQYGEKFQESIMILRNFLMKHFASKLNDGMFSRSPLTRLPGRSFQRRRNLRNLKGRAEVPAPMQQGKERVLPERQLPRGKPKLKQLLANRFVLPRMWMGHCKTSFHISDISVYL